jgi:hypothetical protein
MKNSLKRLRRMRCTGYVALMGKKRNAYRLLMESQRETDE